MADVEKERIKEHAERNFKRGLYCAESVVLSITKAHGIESELLPKAATAFCSGMSRTCGACGALTGAVMGISAILGRSDAGESVDDAYKATGLLIEKFQQEFGAKDCHELLGCDLGTPEGQTAFRENHLHERCKNYTSKAAEFAGEILSQFHNRRIVPVAEANEVISLLEECGLPVDDIGSNQSIEFYGMRSFSGLAGTVGLEVMPDVALLRSVAVPHESRSRGIGKEMVEFAESKARTLGAARIYLLTTTAKGYFEKLGYRTIGRDLAPKEIRETDQFDSVCPSSAVLMVKELSD